MNWVKKGLIFNADNHFDWAVNGAMIPTPIRLHNSIIRVFLTFLDKKGIGRTGFVDLDQKDLTKVINISEKPLFDIGQAGTFDENGALTCSVVQTSNHDFYIYYAGFELGQKIRYRLLSGLTILNKDFSLSKKHQIPVLERSSSELFFRGGPFCMYDEGIYKMWYVAGSSWQNIDGKSMPVYDIRYLESNDGIQWGDKGKKCIEITHENEHGFGRPYVIKHQGIYKMFYSIRIKKIGYRLGYAESKNGIDWIRKDELINLDVSANGFDNDMICYSAVLEINNQLVMFYNGNDFGKTGFGYAVLERYS